ncbi:unnamed protein product [marine sediment metagenome]|uniref:Uncharacterized protein n=1 Tax=marine sediment metagenome TaxID=412755 RepID=X1NMV2_9ZZZZ
MANIAAAISDAVIAPLLRVIASPKRTAATTIPQVINRRDPDASDSRFLNFSINNTIAAKEASNANEPAELLVVKKP